MEKLKNVAIVGALGKMGRGISLVLFLEQAWQSVRRQESFTLRLIDVNTQEAKELRKFFRAELKRSAEKRIVELRQAFQNTALISNEEMIARFIEEAMDSLEISSDLGAAGQAELIFEAASEEVPLKIELFKKLKASTLPQAWFFTNTSSIPIHILNERAGLEGRIIGFHFYNPPMVQKLMEIIPLAGGLETLKEFAVELAVRLKKRSVISNDRAGFIGNGFFMREIALALHLALECTHSLKGEVGAEKGMWAIDRITGEWLLRPMGIFQLIDYVGIDVCLNIARVMSEFGKEKYAFPLLEKALALNLKGGSALDGMPKNGFFAYEGIKPVAIYCFDSQSYVPLPPLDFLGKRIESISWKTMHKMADKEAISRYFTSLFQEGVRGGGLAQLWLQKDLLFMQELVQSGVAYTLNDVAAVLKLGFHHIYSPNEVINGNTPLS